MNHGILFIDENNNRKHSMDDWGLILEKFSPPFPNTKTDFVEIEGGNGSLDLTEVYGKVYFSDLSFNIKFKCKEKIKYDKTLDKIASFIHGKKLKIFLYYDEDYYYYGRAEINPYASGKGLATITIKINAGPYRFRKYKTIEIFDVKDKKTVILKNDRMETTPSFLSDTEMTFNWNGNSYTINEYETIYPEIELVEGNNIIEFIGNGRVTVSYQEGKF